MRKIIEITYKVDSYGNWDRGYKWHGGYGHERDEHDEYDVHFLGYFVRDFLI